MPCPILHLFAKFYLSISNLDNFMPFLLHRPPILNWTTWKNLALPRKHDFCKPKSSLNITSTTCCQSSSKTPVICCQISSYFNKTELLPTRHGTHRNGLRRTVLTSSVRMNGRLTLQILTPWTTTFGAPCFTDINNFHPNPRTRSSWSMLCRQSGMNYRKTQ